MTIMCYICDTKDNVPTNSPCSNPENSEYPGVPESCPSGCFTAILQSFTDGTGKTVQLYIRKIKGYSSK